MEERRQYDEEIYETRIKGVGIETATDDLC
jgi:hypothetical protein